MKMSFMDGYIAGEVQERGTSNGYMLMFGFNSADNKRKQDGTWESIPNYFDCKYFYKDERDPTAEAIKAKKGKMLMRATPHQDKWQAEDGSKRSKVSFTVDTVACIPSSTPAMEDASVYSDEVPF